MNAFIAHYGFKKLLTLHLHINGCWHLVMDCTIPAIDEVRNLFIV